MCFYYALLVKNEIKELRRYVKTVFAPPSLLTDQIVRGTPPPKTSPNTRVVLNTDRNNLFETETLVPTFARTIDVISRL